MSEINIIDIYQFLNMTLPRIFALEWYFGFVSGILVFRHRVAWVLLSGLDS